MATVTASPTLKGRPKNYFKKHIMFLKLCGISLTGDESVAYKLYSFLFLSSTMYAYGILDTFELFKHDFETSSGILIYQSGITIAAFFDGPALFTTLIVLKNRANLGKVLSKFEEEPFLADPNRGGAEEERLIRECNWKINAQLYLYLIGASISIIVSGLYGLSTRLRSDDYRDWQMGFGPFTALNVTYSPNYEISWFYQLMGVLISCQVFTAINLIIAAVMAHISYQFKILQNVFRSIVINSYQDMLQDTANNNLQPPSITMVLSDNDIDPSVIPWKYLQKLLKNAVRYHIAIIDMAKELEELCRYLLLLEFLGIMSPICLEMYQASSIHTAFGVLRHLVEGMAAAFHVILPCYWGEQIMVESEKVGMAAYESNFVGSDLRFQKSLILIIRRSQDPTKLTAGKFTGICLLTCAGVMRASYTYFTVLRNINTNKI